MFKALIEGVVSGIFAPAFQWLNKKEDTKVVQITADRDTKIDETQGDTQVIQARTGLLGILKDNWEIKLGWAMFIIPTGLWYIGIILDCLGRKYFGWEWRVLALPSNIQYIPYAVITFLFGLAWRGKL